MTKFTVILVVLIITCSPIKSQTHTEKLRNNNVKRELLKDYFLCVCLSESFEDVKENDISESVYFDIIRYSPKVFEKINVYAKKFIATIESTQIDDLGNKKAITLQILEKYKSKELDKFIKSLDKYILDE